MTPGSACETAASPSTWPPVADSHQSLVLPIGLPIGSGVGCVRGGISTDVGPAPAAPACAWNRVLRRLACLRSAVLVDRGRGRRAVDRDPRRTPRQPGRHQLAAWLRSGPGSAIPGGPLETAAAPDEPCDRPPDGPRHPFRIDPRGLARAAYGKGDRAHLRRWLGRG